VPSKKEVPVGILGARRDRVVGVKGGNSFGAGLRGVGIGGSKCNSRRSRVSLSEGGSHAGLGLLRGSRISLCKL
jgi:hypothetical protein